jgi:hypothetical protein
MNSNDAQLGASTLSSTSDAGSKDPVDDLDLKNPYLAALLALLVPGLGHLYQRRFAKGALFFVLISLLFWAGISLGSYRTIYFRWDAEEWRPESFAHFFVGVYAWPGLIPPAEVDRAKWLEEIEIAHRRGRDMELARIFTVVAGLLNLLVIADAFDGPAYRVDELERRRREREASRVGGGSNESKGRDVGDRAQRSATA